MKGTTQASAVLLSLILVLPTEAYPKSTNEGAGDIENMLLFEREAIPHKKESSQSTTSGGNHVQTTYTFNKDKFGNNSPITLGTSNGVQGGGTKARRALEILDLYQRSLDDDILYSRHAEAEPFLDGGKAKGGDSSTKGGNHAQSAQNLSGKTIGAGAHINMGNINRQQGGNTIGGNGAANFGKGGGAGTLSVPLPPMPARRSLLEVRGIAEDGHEGFNKARLAFNTQPHGMNVHASTHQRGGNVRSHHSASNTANRISPGEKAIARRWLGLRDANAEAEAFLNGGGAKGGDSKTRGGNWSKNEQKLGKGNIGAGASVNMGNSNVQTGGNTMGGKGGANAGNGGQGGSFSVPMPPIPMRRDLEYLEVRDADADADADADGDLDLYYELFTRSAYADPEAEAEADFEIEE